ncbi:Uncharacterised protein [Vibrio cholerae]|nr:Uncharacterised protein [Vibrio cholerae]
MRSVSNPTLSSPSGKARLTGALSRALLCIARHLTLQSVL